MKIGLLSDTHNDHANTRRALGIFQQRGITRLFHCGDLTTPETMTLFAGWDISFVLGNMDGEALLSEAAQKLALPAPRAVVTATIGGYRIAMAHGHQDEHLANIISSQQYPYVFTGHTHRRRDDQVGQTRVINPGALGGRQPQTRSVAVLDLAEKALEFIELV